MSTKKSVIVRPYFHTVIYGPQGTGKSDFLATFARAYLKGMVGGPLLVFMFDPRGKDASYLAQFPEDGRRIYMSEPGDIELKEGQENLGQFGKIDLILPFTEVYVKGKLVTRVEYFHEEELDFGESAEVITGWTVLPKVRKRLNQLFREERDVWGTVGWDSATSSELTIRSYHQYVQNAGARGEARKQWWGASTDEHEKILAVRFGGWAHNFVVICHTDKDKAAEEAGGGILRYNPRLPGRLSGDLSSYFPEVYHSTVERDADGNATYVLETRPRDKYTAMSAKLKAPDPCENEYESLWSNWA